MFQKIMTFVIIPLLLGHMLHTPIGKFGSMGRSSIIYGIGFGILSAGIIFLGYYFLRDIIEWPDIQKSITDRGVTEYTYLLIFGYIMFGNSLVEEYFFRGIIFYNLALLSRPLAYGISALMFSFYHMAIFGTWFSGYILWLALFGLLAGGVFFAWLYEKTEGLWGAWIFHILADHSILVIGYTKLFS